TLLAATPLPWWSWTPLLHVDRNALPDVTATRRTSVDQNAAQTAFTPPGTVSAGSDSVVPGWSLTGLSRLWNQLHPALGRVARNNSVWGACVLTLLLAGTGFSVARLLVGLCAVRLCQRNSRPLLDAVLLSMLATLRREMGCRRRIEVREARDIG